MPVVNDTKKWLVENQQFFLPPVCNKLMYEKGQLKLFYVGGPNVRKDYHIEEGEELFYMLKGDMCLKIIEQGQHKDVPIREGELFLLPARVAHSPQRVADTIGMVIERERAPGEKDGLRYHVEKDGKPTLQSLYEEWFHCDNLGTDLPPVINRFFASEQYKTGKPLPGTIPENPPVTLDSKVRVEPPFVLSKWIAENRATLDSAGFKKPFRDGYQFEVVIYGKGENTGKCDAAETFIWQIAGPSTVQVEGTVYDLQEDHTMLVEVGKEYKATRPPGSISLICCQDPRRK